MTVGPLYGNAVRALLLVGVPAGSAAHAATYLPLSVPAQLVVGLALAGVYTALAVLVLPPVRRDARVTASFARQALTRRRGAAAVDVGTPDGSVGGAPRGGTLPPPPFP